MPTEQILKKIYEDLKKQMLENSKTTFLREYTIPSINYNPNSKKIENLYFVSGIQMELYRIIEQFDNEIYFTNYKDKYFFSNDKEIVTTRMLFEIEQEAKQEQKTQRKNIR